MAKQICFTVEDELAAALNKLAERTRQSRSALIQTLLKTAIREERQ